MTIWTRMTVAATVAALATTSAAAEPAVLKGRDACDIVVKKIASLNTYNSEIQPTSIYHVEYEPKLIIRGSTSYAKIHS